MSLTYTWFIKVTWLIIVFLLLQPNASTSREFDAITPNQNIKDGDVLVSSSRRFALGFFSPGNSLKRYVGVWYYQVPNQTVVWVANRDDPIPVNDTSGILAIHGDGGLAIYGNNRSNRLWSADFTLSSPNTSIAKLLDTGNLVLLDTNEKGNQNVVWEGFDHPTDTVLPYMKLGLDRRTGLERFLTSWKSQDDPGTGSCVYRIDTTGLAQLVLYKNGSKWWRAGSWTSHGMSGIAPIIDSPNIFIINSSYVYNENEISVTYVDIDDLVLSRTVLDESGTLARVTWNGRWNNIWSAPLDRCDHYAHCGINSNCDPDNVVGVECICLPGFEPKSPADWYLRDWSGGCIRSQNGLSSMCGNGEGFVKLSRVKIPDSSIAVVYKNLSSKACKQECLKNCSCNAYSSQSSAVNIKEVGCVTWYGDLMDTITTTLASFGQELHVRVNATVLAESGGNSKAFFRRKGMLAIPILSSLLVLVLMTKFAGWWLKIKRNTKEADELEETRRHPELQFFDLDTLMAATNHFSHLNELGHGGFGSVYKAQLPNEQKVAIKRLSRTSGQGTEEFKNEVALIARLQHRNLVKLLGCCIKGEERMLILEYMPNKSLDSFLFDHTRKSCLKWEKRFEIINGITRGILYLHQDSRLRIIHRDLKTSNVLLDAEMNPKISDFGMARILDANQVEDKTNRIVGTYGYMSPEYAVFGRFSTKSDVFSFGIILLEIVTGAKNNGSSRDDPSMSLIGHVWRLWGEDRVLEVVDSTLEPYDSNEVMRCIQVALLCVQEDAKDRPDMAAVVFMLSSEASRLCPPKQPAYVYKGTDTDPLFPKRKYSMNELTVTAIEAR